jgi:hypothetical protein
MIRLALVLSVALGIALPSVADAQRPQERRCLVELLGQDRGLVYDVPIPGNENYYAGGNVRLRCQRQPVFLGADSVVSYNGDVVQLITRAYYRDEDINVTADSMVYTRINEKIEARGNVVAVNRANGSTLTGPWVDHYRAVRGIRDTAETTALQRPTVEYAVARTEADTAEPAPYKIEADRMRERGPRLEGWGGVVITRDSLRGLADSVLYLTDSTGMATLYGPPAELRRTGADSFLVRGDEVRLGITGEELDRIEAHGGGQITNGVADVIGESVAIALVDGTVSQTLAWDREALARVLAEGYDVRGDSVAIDTPGERLRELRVFGNGILRSPLPDSVPEASDSLPEPLVPADSLPADTLAAVAEDDDAIRDQMTGNRITARFVDVDSAGTILTRLLDIVATGSATSLYAREVERNGRLEPTINYTRADTIIILMKTGDSTGIHEVRAFRGREPVDGIQLERASVRAARRPTEGAARPEELP